MTTSFTHHYYIKQNNTVFFTAYFNACLHSKERITTFVFWPPYDYESFSKNFNSVDFFPLSRATHGLYAMPEHLLTISQIEVDFQSPPPPQPSSACFIDFERQQITLYEEYFGEIHLPVRRIVIRLMHETWPNWKIHWAENGYLELLEIVGYKNILFETETKMNKMNVDQQTTEWFDNILYGFSPISHQAHFQNFVQDSVTNLLRSVSTSDQYPFGTPNFVITHKTSEWCVDYGYDCDAGALFSVGPAILEQLDEIQPLDSFKPPIKLKEKASSPSAGLMIDTEEKHMSFWLDHFIDPRLIKAMQEIWPNWRVSWHTKGLPYQYFLAGCDPQLVMMSFKEAKAEALKNTPNFAPGPNGRNEALPTLKELIDGLQPDYIDLWKTAGEMIE